MSLMDAKDKRIAELETLLKAALEEIARLKAEIAILKKHSGNSSKPPSSDIVKAKTEKRDKKTKRKKGAQPGHKQHLRTPIPPEFIDEIVKLELTNCPDCQQQLDLVDSENLSTNYTRRKTDCRYRISTVEVLVQKLPVLSLCPLARSHRKSRTFRRRYDCSYRLSERAGTPVLSYTAILLSRCHGH